MDWPFQCFLDLNVALVYIYFNQL